MKIKEIMNPNVLTITSERSVFYASKIMNEHSIGSLVVKEGEEIVGILTSRDIRTTHGNRLVADAMSADPITMDQEETVWEAMDVMARHRIEHLPIVDHAELVGIVTLSDIKASVAGFTDVMTGLHKKEYIIYLIRRWLKEHIYFNVIFVDIDDFGSINKRFGHPFGDRVIISFADHLKAMVGESEYLCRYAGDEFVIVHRGDKEEALALIRKIESQFCFDHMTVCSSTGVLIGREVEHFFQLSPSEILKQASLQSTEKKNQGKTG